MEYRRFELKDDTKENRDKFERLLVEKNLSREDVVFIVDQVRLSNTEHDMNYSDFISSVSSAFSTKRKRGIWWKTRKVKLLVLKR